MLLGLVQCLVLPHTLFGIGLLLYLIHSVLLCLCGTTIEGTINRRAWHTTTKGHRFYSVWFVYQVAGGVHEAKASVSKREYDRFKQGAAVQVRTLSFGEWTRGELIIPGQVLLSRFGPFALFATFWCGFMAPIAWGVYVAPLRDRALVRHGATASGRIREKRTQSGKRTSYLLDYEFTTPGGERGESSMYVRKDVWDSLQQGQTVTVLYSEKNPRRSLIYQGADYLALAD